MKTAAFRRILELEELPDNSKIQGISLGPRGEVVLRAETTIEPAVTAQPQKHVEAMQSKQWQYFLVQGATAKKLSPTQRGYLHVQPFGLGRFLWVKSRCSSGEDNAFLQGISGEVVATFHLGDGVEDVQATNDGSIWVSYFDEGVFGGSVGTAGLASFSEKGDLEFDFNAGAETRGIPYIADCYAFNATDDGVYAYYYTDFPLVLIKSGMVSKICDVPISGARAFAIHGDRSLFCGGYNRPTSLFSVHLPSVRVEELQPARDDGSTIDFACAAARGSCLYVATQKTLYVADISDASF